MNIRKRGSTYQIRVYDNSRRKTFSTTYRPPPGLSAAQEKRAAEKAGREFEEKVKSGWAANGNITVSEFLGKWFISAEAQLKPRTVKLYKDMSRRVEPAMGGMLLSDVKPVHILEFISGLERGIQGVKNKAGKMTRKQSTQPLSPKTVKNYLMFLSTIFTAAENLGYIEVNPAAKVKPPRQVKPRVESLDHKQTLLFLQEVDKRPIVERLIFYLLIFTGLRRGELLGLEWKDIDFGNHTISIRRTSQYSPALGIYTDTPKTESSRRTLKVSSTIIGIAEEYREAQKQQAKEYGRGWKNDIGRLFTRTDGSPMHPNTPYKMLKRILKKTDLPDVSLHSLRHSNATILINNGIDVKTVSGRLGHSNTSTTLNIYAEQFSAADAAAADAIDLALLRKPRLETESE